MGKYFVMSKRFNKHNAEDFGLKPIDTKTAFNPTDDSYWIKTDLYDFGWGKENGYYKEPLPDFLSLFDITLHSKNWDDVFGAAAVILKLYPDELLVKCEELMIDKKHKRDFQKIAEIFKLKDITNRSSVINKTFFQIQNDYERWYKVSCMANKL